jgi:hypothetical protein
VKYPVRPPRWLKAGSPRWAPLRTDEGLVGFDIGGDEAYFRRVAAFIGDRDDVTAMCGDRTGRFGPRDLEFLRFLPRLRRFSVDEGALTSLDGLRHLPEDTTAITVGASSRQVSLLPLQRFRELRTLYLERQHRDIQVIGELRTLEDLTLRSMTLPDLSILLPLEGLVSLDIKLGGTKDLRLLPRICRLRYLELWLIRGLEDVDAIGEILSLEELFLQALKHVTHIPSLRRLDGLRTVTLETMRGLTDLSPIAEAPGLETLRLIDFRHATPEIVRPFVGHPTLKEAAWGFGSINKNEAAQALVPLDPELKVGKVTQALLRAFGPRR